MYVYTVQYQYQQVSGRGRCSTYGSTVVLVVLRSCNSGDGSLVLPCLALSCLVLSCLVWVWLACPVSVSLSLSLSPLFSFSPCRVLVLGWAACWSLNWKGSCRAGAGWSWPLPWSFVALAVQRHGRRRWRWRCSSFAPSYGTTGTLPHPSSRPRFWPMEP